MQPFGEDDLEWFRTLGTGSAHGARDLELLTNAEVEKLRKELRDRERRRIAPGFALPAEEEE